MDTRQRLAKDDGRLKGWRDVKASPALLMTAQHSNGPFSASARWVTRLAREGERQQGGAWTMQFETAYGLALDETSSLQAGYALTLMNARFAQTFFAVEQGLAQRSGLALHRAGAGIMSHSVFLQWQMGRGDGWHMLARTELESLTGQAGRSPLVRRRLQPSVLVAVTRPF